MKILQTIGLIITVLAIGLLPVGAQELATLPPVVVKTVPEAGARDVAAATTEIRVTFSKKMMDGSWSWSTAWQGSSPEMIGKPKYEADGKTCVIKVKLEPGKTYGYWINSEKFRNFKDASGKAYYLYGLP